MDFLVGILHVVWMDWRQSLSTCPADPRYDEFPLRELGTLMSVGFETIMDVFPDKELVLTKLVGVYPFDAHVEAC